MTRRRIKVKRTAPGRYVVSCPGCDDALHRGPWREAIAAADKHARVWHT